MNDLNLLEEPDDLDLSLVRYAADAVQAAHRHDAPSLGVVIGGGLAETANGETGEYGVGAVAIKPSGVVHGDRFGASGAAMLSIKGGSSPAFAPGRLRWMTGAAFARRGFVIVAALSEGDPFGAAQEAAWHLLGTASAADDARPSASPSWLARIREEIASSATRPSLATLARSGGVHPVSLGRAFRRHYGCSIGDFVRRLRVQRATDLLRRSPVPAAMIAATVGFADQSHMCRAFRAEIGVAPGRYRALTRERPRKNDQ